MKKFLKTLLVVIMIVGLTGCAKYNVNMAVSNDKSVTLEVIYGINSSLMSSFNGEEDSTDEDDWTWSSTDDEDSDETIDEIKTEDFSFLEKKGYKVEAYSEDTDSGTITGVKLTKTFKNIDDITKNSKKVVDLVNMFDTENEDSFDDSQLFYKNGDNYKASFKFDFSDEEGIDYSAYNSYFDLKYQITLPTKAISNNATLVSDDGKTLTWDLSYGKNNDVEFEFNFAQESNILIYILTGTGIVIIVGVLAVIIIKSKNKPRNNGGSFNNNLNNQPFNNNTSPTPVPTPTSTPVSSQQPIEPTTQQSTHNFCANCGQKLINGICPSCNK